MTQLKNKILVGTHHKTGTVWMLKIFQQISNEFRLIFHYGDKAAPTAAFDIYFQDHSRFQFGRISENYRGVHIIRDPRDTIVSGCFYHQKSPEKWLHVKQEKFGGLSYHEKINSYSLFDDKLLFEMENSGYTTITDMYNWEYENPHFYEIKYEDLINDKNLNLFNNIYLFLGFKVEIIPRLLQIAFENSIFSGNVNKSLHQRSGLSNQWKDHFKSIHRLRFNELFDDVLAKLRYENNNDWIYF